MTAGKDWLTLGKTRYLTFLFVCIVELYVLFIVLCNLHRSLITVTSYKRNTSIRQVLLCARGH